MFFTVYRWLETIPLIGALFRRLRWPINYMMLYFFRPDARKQWERRIRDALSAKDNQHIPRIQGAGKIELGYLLMHNGIRVLPGSYYGEPMCRLLRENRGVHEPQEERVFMEVLKYMPSEAVIIELGSYWGFYSMWFSKEVENPYCLLVEPSKSNLKHGEENFRINGMAGEFVNAFVGAPDAETIQSTPVISVDQLVEKNKIKQVHILHSDIQGAELDMLKGAQITIDRGGVDYVFISTHSNELHEECLKFILEKNFEVLAEANLDESFSVDGIIVAQSLTSKLPGPGPVSIDKKSKAERGYI